MEEMEQTLGKKGVAPSSGLGPIVGGKGRYGERTRGRQGSPGSGQKPPSESQQPTPLHWLGRPGEVRSWTPPPPQGASEAQ